MSHVTRQQSRFKTETKTSFSTEPMKIYDGLGSRDDVFIVIARKDVWVMRE